MRRRSFRALEGRRLAARRPRPRVAKPERRQQVQGRRVGTAVVRGHLDEDVVGRGLGVLDEHVEIAILGEDPRVDQLVLELVAAAPAVRRHQVVVRKLALRILVERLQVGVRGRAVQVEPVVLGVLAVIAFAVRQPEHALLEDRIDAVPHGEREAQTLTLVADPRDPVLPPAIGARARLVVREVVPGVAAAAVVLAHGAPLALAEVGTPREPRLRFPSGSPPADGALRSSCSSFVWDPRLNCGRRRMSAGTEWLSSGSDDGQIRCAGAPPSHRSARERSSRTAALLRVHRRASEKPMGLEPDPLVRDRPETVFLLLERSRGGWVRLSRVAATLAGHRALAVDAPAARGTNWMRMRRVRHARTGTGVGGALGWNGRISAWSGPTMP